MSQCNRTVALEDKGGTYDVLTLACGRPQDHDGDHVARLSAEGTKAGYVRIEWLERERG